MDVKENGLAELADKIKEIEQKVAQLRSEMEEYNKNYIGSMEYFSVFVNNEGTKRHMREFVIAIPAIYFIALFAYKYILPNVIIIVKAILEGDL